MRRLARTRIGVQLEDLDQLLSNAWRQGLDSPAGGICADSVEAMIVVIALAGFGGAI